MPITLAEAKKFLRLDYTDEDEYITHLIQVADEHCASYLEKTLTEYPSRYKQAVLLLVGHFYENRETATNDRIPATIQTLLAPLRRYNF